MNWKSFIYNLTAGNIIPVIGNDLSLLKGENETPVPLYDYITKKLLEIEDISDPNQSISEIVLGNPQIASTIKSIYEQIEEDRFYTRSLEKLAEITDFKFYVSTTVDDLLVKAIRKVRKYKEKDSKLNVINYSLQGKSPKIVKPKVTVFNLLGNLCELKHSAIDEEEMLEYFFSIAWKENEDHPQADYFIRCVSDKSFLFIGCDFPDWLMRFVIRILSNRRIKDQTFNDYIVVDTGKEHLKLKNFLDLCKKDFVVISGEGTHNTEVFVDQLHKKWMDKKKEDKHMKYEGSVFLSYFHQDETDAEDLKNALEKEGIDVWFDKDDLREGEHKKRIWDAIDRCKIFIPIISNKCLAAAKSYAKQYEWPTAEMIYVYKKNSGQKFYILPCSVCDIDRKDDRIPGFMKNFTIFDLKIKQDIIVDAIKTLLKIKL